MEYRSIKRPNLIEMMSVWRVHITPRNGLYLIRLLMSIVSVCFSVSMVLYYKRINIVKKIRMETLSETLDLHHSSTNSGIL